MWANSGSNDEFPVVRLDWYSAETIIQEMNTQQWAGFDDWRLPTIKELFVLSRQIKTMKDRYYLLFSDEKEKCCFWSSTVDENNQYKAWCVNFSHYTGYTDIKDYRYYVRAVRLS